MDLFPPRKVTQSHSELGRQGETFVIARLMQVGYTVLVPVDGVQRYDLVIEDADQRLTYVGINECWLRLEPAQTNRGANRWGKDALWAADYEL